MKRMNGTMYHYGLKCLIFVDKIGKVILRSSSDPHALPPGHHQPGLKAGLGVAAHRAVTEFKLTINMCF